MRKLLLTALLAVWMPCILNHARGEEPKAIVEKAIRAHGGEDRLARLKIVRTRAKGNLILGGAEVPFTMDVSWQWPNQYKAVAEIAATSQKATFRLAFDGTNGWAGVNEAVADLADMKLDDLKAQVHLRRVLVLTPLLADKTYQLSALDEVQVNGKPAVGVKVAAKGQRELRLYFDKTTGLLARIDRQVLDDATMREVAQQDYPSDYKDMDGLKVAMKEVWHRSGTKVLEMDFAEIKFPEKIAVAEFAKPSVSTPADNPLHTRTADVIYGRKFGTALTMDVFTPKKGANGAAIVLVVSGGWVSDNQTINSAIFAVFLGELGKRGYTCFAVVHGSQPRYTIPEAVADLNRAVRFIRLHAKQYRIDPERIGITGGSAGGHLSLMQGTAGDSGNPKAADLLDRTSSRVQAVACFFPPTDFLNYGGEGKYAFAPDGLLKGFRVVVDVRELDAKTMLYERVTDAKKVQELARRISPVTHVSADDPPTLIIHGDADTLVPLQQSEAIMAKFKEAGVAAQLVVRKKRGHDFSGGAQDMVLIADWFDKYLKAK